MKAVVFLGGEPYRGTIETQGAYVVACDAGYLQAQSRGITPDLVLGDFDSLGYVPEGALTVPAEKNFTDGEMAIEELFLRKESLSLTEIEVYGGGGMREDHFLGVLQLLLFAKKRGLLLTIITNYSKIYLKDASFSSKCGTNRTVSLIPFSGDVHIINSEGLYYPLKNLTLRQGETRGISNRTEKETFSLEFGGGNLLVVEVAEGCL